MNAPFIIYVEAKVFLQFSNATQKIATSEKQQVFSLLLMKRKESRSRYFLLSVAMPVIRDVHRSSEVINLLFLTT